MKCCRIASSRFAEALVTSAGVKPERLAISCPSLVTLATVDLVAFLAVLDKTFAPDRAFTSV